MKVYCAEYRRDWEPKWRPPIVIKRRLEYGGDAGKLLDCNECKHKFRCMLDHKAEVVFDPIARIQPVRLKTNPPFS